MRSTSKTICFVVLFLAAFVATGYDAFPHEQVQLADEVQPYANTLVDQLAEESNHAEGEHRYRTKRLTCDLLSAFRVEHSACAARCVLFGNVGGYCNPERVCVCRRSYH